MERWSSDNPEEIEMNRRLSMNTETPVIGKIAATGGRVSVSVSNEGQKALSPGYARELAGLIGEAADAAENNVERDVVQDVWEFMLEEYPALAEQCYPGSFNASSDEGALAEWRRLEKAIAKDNGWRVGEGRAREVAVRPDYTAPPELPH